MAKYLVETYYTCSFKVNHYLEKIDEKEMANLEKRDDGKFEILDIKLENRKTKNLSKTTINIENKSNNNKEIFSESPKPKVVSAENKQLFIKKLNEGVSKRFSMPDRRKGTFKKLLLVIIKYIFTLANMKTEKLEKFLSIQVKKVN